MKPLCVSVTVAASEADSVSGTLWALGTVGIEERTEANGSITLRAGFDDREAADRAAAQIGRPVLIEVIADDSYLDGWRAHATIWRAGTRIVVRPPWIPDHETSENDLVLEIDPGRAFGSGSHASTRLVLGLLETALRPGDRLLDVGCGSGVLSIAAARLGCTAVGVDIDPAAIEASDLNAAANGVDDEVVFSETPLDTVDGRFDIVASNISAAADIELAALIMERTRAGGLIALGGLLENRLGDVVAAYPSTELVEVVTDDGWACPLLRVLPSHD